MRLSYLLLLLFSCLSNSVSGYGFILANDEEELFVSVKYIPFSLKTRVPIDEKAIDYMELGNGLQVKKDTIFSNYTYREILSKLKNIKASNSTYYSLRMKINIKLNNNDLREIYADPRKNQLIINGEVYEDTEGVIKTIIENICRPYFHNLISESKYWLNNNNDCGDSLEFVKYYKNIDFNNSFDNFYKKHLLDK